MSRLRTTLLPTAGVAAALGVGLALVVGSPPAPAATSAAEPVALLTLTGSGGKALRKAGVSVRATAPALGTSTVLRLPVTSTKVGTSATVALGGSLAFRKGARRAAATKLTVTLKRGGTRLTATLGGHRVTLATATPPASRLLLDAKGKRAGVGATTVTLGSAAARTIKRKLHLRTTPRGRLGTLTVLAEKATVTTTTGTKTTTTPVKTTTTGTTTTTTTTTTTPPPPTETSTLPRPGTAVAVSGATITWHVRDSFVQYIASGTGTSAEAGATADAATGGCTASGTPVTFPQLAYQYHFPFRAGWYDPVSHHSSLIFAGTVRFRYPGHGIDLAVQNPEIQLNGAASQAVLRYGSNASDKGDLRGDVFDLTLGAPAAKVCSEDPGPQGIDDRDGSVPSSGGHRYVYERMPGVVPSAATDSVFNGFYAAGDPFGWVTVTFTTAA